MGFEKRKKEKKRFEKWGGNWEKEADLLARALGEGGLLNGYGLLLHLPTSGGTLLVGLDDVDLHLNFHLGKERVPVLLEHRASPLNERDLDCPAIHTNTP
eukprot:COSAG05_NODE_371_length_10705_cov_99.051475_8_plen_100_part_00